MRFFKKGISILFISLIILSSVSVNIVSADDTTEEWTNVTTNEELVEAFVFYCKSRDLTIEGSIADAITSMTTNAFTNICNALGLDMTAIQADLKKSTDGNLGVRYLFNRSGISTYNRIFAQFLQDHELEVGDTDVNKQLYSGLWVTDADNNGCFAFEFHNSVTAANCDLVGTPLKYGSGSSFKILFDSGIRSLTFHFLIDDNKTQTIQEYLGSHAASRGNIYDSSSSYVYPLYDPDDSSNYGYYSIAHLQNTSPPQYYFINMYFEGNSLFYVNNRGRVDVGIARDTSINIVAPIINANNYEGDTIINNNGDTNNYNPPTPTPDGGTPPDDWDIQLPNLDHDWLIHGLEKKFPFDIPFNLLFALSILNAEPQTPRFQGDLDLGIYIWHYDLDLAPFEDIARYFREFQFFAFIVGLMLLTKQLIWG